MRRNFPAILMLCVLLVLSAWPQVGDEGGRVRYARYTSYFEKNDSGLKGGTSFLVFTSQPDFDRVFGPAAVMGRNSFLPAGTFQTKIVVASIRRGNFFRSYEVKKVTKKDGKLYVWYSVKDSKPGSAMYNSPLMLAVAKGDYSSVVFMQDGTEAGVVPAPKP